MTKSSGRISARLTQKVAFSFIWLCGIIAMLVLFVLVGYVFFKGVGSIDREFLFTAPIGGLDGEGGISTVIITTLYLVILTTVILTPLGIGAAIYLVEYASDNWLTHIIRYVVDMLAGVPSIIMGLFGYVLFVIVLHFNFSLLSGALTLVCLELPTMIRTVEEALRTVPRSYREAGLSLGATKWQTVRQVILPAAMPGVITGIILTMGRTVEETACLYVTMGGSSAMPTSLLSGGRTLSLHLFYLATETRAFDKAMGTGVILILIIIVMNVITHIMSHRFHAKMGKR
ncbi:MAG: phosphate ABC transporter permease PstA [Dehalococcoidia bacterium]|nr:phosphate ABC transporter permease PstA [Dehalococcoidia bacterium]